LRRRLYAGVCAAILEAVFRKATRKSGARLGSLCSVTVPSRGVVKGLLVTFFIAARNCTLHLDSLQREKKPRAS
jgi:hypothetical protein